MTMAPDVDLVDVNGSVKSSRDVISNDVDLAQEMGKGVDDRLVCFHLGALSLKYFGLSDEEEKEKDTFYKDKEKFIFNKKSVGRFVAVFGSLSLLVISFLSYLFYMLSLKGAGITRDFVVSIAFTIIFVMCVGFIMSEVRCISSFVKSYLERYEFDGGSSSSFLRSLKIDMDKELKTDDVSAYLSWVRAMVTRVDSFYNFPEDMNFTQDGFNMSDYYMCRAISRLNSELSNAENNFISYKSKISKAGYVDRVAAEKDMKKNLLNVSTKYGIFMRNLLGHKNNPYKDMMEDMVHNHNQERDLKMSEKSQAENKEMIRQTIRNNEKLLKLIGEKDV